MSSELTEAQWRHALTEEKARHESALEWQADSWIREEGDAWEAYAKRYVRDFDDESFPGSRDMS